MVLIVGGIQNRSRRPKENGTICKTERTIQCKRRRRFQIEVDEKSQRTTLKPITCENVHSLRGKFERRRADEISQRRETSYTGAAMALKPRKLVFDNRVIILCFEDKPAGAKIEERIINVNERKVPLRMGDVNFGNVWYNVAPQTSSSDAGSILGKQRSGGIQPDKSGWNSAREAAMPRSTFKTSNADGFVAALSLQQHTHLITGDTEVNQIEKK